MRAAATESPQRGQGNATVYSMEYVFWAILLLSESYSAGIWLSLILMACGLFLVQPRLAEAE